MLDFHTFFVVVVVLVRRLVCTYSLFTHSVNSFEAQGCIRNVVLTLCVCRRVCMCIRLCYAMVLTDNDNNRIELEKRQEVNRNCFYSVWTSYTIGHRYSECKSIVDQFLDCGQASIFVGQVKWFVDVWKWCVPSSHSLYRRLQMQETFILQINGMNFDWLQYWQWMIRGQLTWIVAANSDPNPLVNGASCAMSTRPVFFADWNWIEKRFFREIRRFENFIHRINHLPCISFLCPMAISIRDQSLHNSLSIRLWPFALLPEAHVLVFPIQSMWHRRLWSKHLLHPMDIQTIRLEPLQPLPDTMFSVRRQHMGSVGEQNVKWCNHANDRQRFVVLTLSLMHANSKPFALFGPLGMTTFMPGVCAKYASGLCEWYRAPWPTAPLGARIVNEPQSNELPLR